MDEKPSPNASSTIPSLSLQLVVPVPSQMFTPRFVALL